VVVSVRGGLGVGGCLGLGCFGVGVGGCVGRELLGGRLGLGCFGGRVGLGECLVGGRLSRARLGARLGLGGRLGSSGRVLGRDLVGRRCLGHRRAALVGPGVVGRGQRLARVERRLGRLGGSLVVRLGPLPCILLLRG